MVSRKGSDMYIQRPPLENPPLMAECVSKDGNLATAVHKTHSERGKSQFFERKLECDWPNDVHRQVTASRGRTLFILMSSVFLFQTHIWPAAPAEYTDCPREVGSASPEPALDPGSGAAP